MIVVGAVVAFVALLPRLIWYYEIDRAGRLLAAGLVWPQPRTIDSLPIAKDSRAVEAAITHLSVAIVQRPDHAYAYRLAGEANAALGNWVDAAACLQLARQKSPRNPTAAILLNSVYEQQLHIDPTQPVDQRRAILREAAIPVQQYIVRGDEALARAEVAEAQMQYERAVLIASKPADEMLWRYVITSIAAKQPLRVSVADSKLVRVATGSTFIEAETMQLLDGTKIQYVKDPLVGTIYHNQAAYAVVDFKRAGKYQMGMRVQHSQPAPVKAQLEFDLKPIAQFELTKGDGTFTEFGQLVEIEPGLHVIGVRFLNDNAEGLLPGQKDRDLTVDYIRFDLFDPALFAARVLDDKPTGLRIEAETMQFWDGKSLKLKEDPNIGAMFVQGTGIAALDVVTAGTYRVSVRAQNPSAATVKFQVESDLQPIARFELPPTGQWQTFDVPVKLEAGKHILSVQLVNNLTSDLTVNYVLALDWLELNRLDAAKYVARALDDNGMLKIEAETTQDWQGRALRFDQNPNVGVIFGQGVSVAAVQVSKAMTYSLWVRTRNFSAVPLVVQLEADFKVIGRHRLTAQNPGWQDIEGVVYLEPGVHFIVMRLPDPSPESPRAEDRNLIADWLYLAPFKANAYPLRTVDGRLQIEAETMQRFDGKPVTNSATPTSAILTENGSLLARVRLPKAGTLVLTGRVQNSSNVPVQFVLEENFQHMASFSTNKSDGTWQEFTAEANVVAGEHFVGVRLMNAAAGRTLVVDWLAVEVR